MANKFELQTPGGTILSFRNPDQVASWKIVGAPSVNREKDISSRGCGFDASGKSATLNRYHVNFWTRTYEVRFTGATWGAAEANAIAVQAAFDEGIKYQEGNGGTVLWLVRSFPTSWAQVAPNIWTVLTGIVIPIGEEEYGINADGTDVNAVPRYMAHVEMDLMVGYDSTAGTPSA